MSETTTWYSPSEFLTRIGFSYASNMFATRFLTALRAAVENSTGHNKFLLKTNDFLPSLVEELGETARLNGNILQVTEKGVAILKQFLEAHPEFISGRISYTSTREISF